MKVIKFFLFFISTFAHAELVDFVDPLIGSGGRLWASSMISPAATAPFGMVKLGPDTRWPWWIPESLHKMAIGTSGYYAPQTRIRGFSHSRLQGTGARVGGTFRILPFSREKKLKHLKTGVRFQKKSETAQAGYYKVYLPKEKVTAEMTASTRCGYHRYTYHKKNRQSFLVLDTTSSVMVGAPAEDITFQIHDTNHFSAESTQQGSFAGRYGGLKAYAYAEISPAPQKWESIEGGTKILFRFGHQENVEVKLCLSYVSAKNAKLNFETEIAKKSFETTRHETTALWENRLSKARITARAQVKKQFYTALYHSMQMPTIMTDVNGEYLGFNQQIGLAQDYTYVSDLSLWDTFRTTHPLYTLIAHDMQLNSVKSLLAMAELNGEFPRWPQGGGDARSMFGNPANFLMSETLLKKIGEFDAQKALRFMVDSVKTPKENPLRNPLCLEYKYCPADLVEESVAKTLEYAWSDFATATLAEALGEKAVASEFYRYSNYFENVWDINTHYFRGRNTDGTWHPLKKNLLTYVDFKGEKSEPYVEGSPRHWRYSAPHAGKKLVDLFGGRDNFIESLDDFASRASSRRAALNPTPHYWHGNQHDIHSLYLFNEASAPEYTQYWVRWALENRYALTRDAYDGNDDGGTLTAWYVLSSLGFYPQAGTDKYWIGSPNIKTAELKIGKASLKITVNNQSEKNVFIKSITLNNKKLCHPEIHQHELAGEIVFTMQDKPAVSGGYQCSNH